MNKKPQRKKFKLLELKINWDVIQIRMLPDMDLTLT